MAKAWTPWRDGRRAWSRLESWLRGDAAARAGEPADGEGALRALSDIGLIRRLLDEAESMAVRASRHNGNSWSEIATRLGITRQSAWERWRDLDEPSEPTPNPGYGVVRSSLQPVLDEAATEMVSLTAQELRRQATVTVPDVTGLPFDAARRVLLEHKLVAVAPDPDGPPIAALGWPDGIVVDQSPESGALVARGSEIKLWIEGEGGGSAGVREPRRPSPDPKSAREMREEPFDEAVG